MGKPLSEIYYSNPESPTTVADALAALVKANDPPFIFVQGNRLVRVHDSGWVEKLGYKAIRCMLSLAAEWYRVSDKGTEVITFAPPETASTIFGLGYWPGIPAYREDRDS